MDFDLGILKDILISFHQMEYILDNTNIRSIKEVSKKISNDISITTKIRTPYKEGKTLLDKETISNSSMSKVGGAFFHDETFERLRRERETLTRSIFHYKVFKKF